MREQAGRLPSVAWIDITGPVTEIQDGEVVWNFTDTTGILVAIGSAAAKREGERIPPVASRLLNR